LFIIKPYLKSRFTNHRFPFTLTHGWDENSVKYDVNGNIQALRRDSSVQRTLTANSGILIDQLKYTYSSSIPDQLYTVYDSSGSAKGFIGGATGSHYTYDANGNLTNEPYQGITGITYNVLNRTDSTKISGTTYITYTYDAGGMLLRKKAYNSGTLTQTDYIDGFVYTGNGTTQTLAYAPMPEGRLLGTALTQEYVITDPQGNARVAFQNVSGVAKVTQENSYYGYGLLMPGSLVGWSAPPNKNLYNGGSEWQNDTKAVNAGVPNYYQTFYRNYDPALARFVAVDPMAEGAESMSAFQYAGDNPIMGNDPVGDLARVKINQPTQQGFNGDPGFADGLGSNMSSGGGGGGIGQNSDPNWMNDGAFDDPGAFSGDRGLAQILYFDPTIYDQHPYNASMAGQSATESNDVSAYGPRLYVGGLNSSTPEQAMEPAHLDPPDDDDGNNYSWYKDFRSIFPSMANNILWTQFGPYPPGARGGPQPLYGGIKKGGKNRVNGIETEPLFEFEIDYDVFSDDGLITSVSPPWASPSGGHWIDDGVGVTATVFGLYWKTWPAVGVPASPALIGGYVEYTYSNGNPPVTQGFYHSVLVTP
jgi:RHS repeat-associated protein